MNRIATLIGVSLCLSLANCGAAEDSPTSAYQALHKCAVRGDWGSIYDRLTDRSRKFTAMLVDPAGFVDGRRDDMSRQGFIDMFAGADEEKMKAIVAMFTGEVIEERPDDEGVVLVVKIEGTENAMIMVESEGRWRLEAFFDLWQAKALQRDTTPALEKKLFQCAMLLGHARGDAAQVRRDTGVPPAELRFANPLSPESVATQVVVIEQVGADGTTVDPSRAGWVWNNADEILHAAGYDEKGIRREKWNRSSPERKRQQLRSLQAGGWMTVGRAEPTEEKVRLEQWGAFENPRPLRNPASPEDVGTRIVTTEIAGADGASVSPATAGWLWNSADRRLYLAGYTDATAPQGSFPRVGSADVP